MVPDKLASRFSAAVVVFKRHSSGVISTPVYPWVSQLRQDRHGKEVIHVCHAMYHPAVAFKHLVPYPMRKGFFSPVLW